MTELTKILFYILLSTVATRSFGLPQETQIQQDCTKLSAPGHYPDYEPLPKYRIEHQDHTPTTPTVLVLQISVAPESFGGSGVIRLGCKLNSDFPKESHIKVLIFDDRKAAANLAAGLTDQKHYGTYLWHLRGRYELDREKKIQFVEFLVPVFEDQLFTIKRYKFLLTPY